MFNFTKQINKENFTKVDGRKIWYSIKGKKGLAPLLIVHGGPSLPHEYLISLEELSNERPIIFYDQLDCGKSEKTNNKNLWNIQYFIHELEVVCKNLNLKNFHLLGHSWGGALAVEYAYRHEENLKSLILASPMLNIDMWLNDMQKIKKNLPSDIQTILNKYEKYETYFNPEYLNAITKAYEDCVCRLLPWPDELVKAGEGQGLGVYKTLWGPNEFICKGNLKDYDCSEKLQEIEINTLYTCGKYDDATPETVKFYKSKSPNSEINMFKNSAHMPHIEERELYLQTIRNFLTKND